MLDAARQAFVTGMSSAAEIGAVVVMFGAVIALVWLPGRARVPAEEVGREKTIGAVAGEGAAS